MSKAEKAGRGSNLKVLIFNIIIAAVCIVAIVTLYVGDFWDASISFNIDKESIQKMMGSTGGSASNASGIKAAEEGSENSNGGMSLEEILSYVDDDFVLSFDINLQISGQTVAKGAVGKSDEAVKELLTTQVNNLVDEVSESVGSVINVSVKAVVKMAIEKAKEAIKTQLRDEMAKQNVSEEEMDAELAKYNISLKAIDDMLDEFMDNIGKMLEGDTQSCITFLQTNTTLRSVARIVSEDELKKADTSKEPTEEEINAKTDEFIQELVDSYNEMIDKLSVDGEFSSETIIIAIMNGTGIMEMAEGNKAQNAAEGEEGATEEKQFKSMEDVKAYLVEKIMGAMGEETIAKVGKVLSYVGYFLFFVMACWAYVLLKIIIKTIFCKNKTVGLFFPRMFGWMPHVFLVGLPTLILNHLPEIMEAAGEGAEQAGEQLTELLNMMTISVSSLTWVSALCSVILLVLLFVYYPMRRRAKKAKKAAKKAE